MKFLNLLIISVCGFGLVACGGGNSKEKSFVVNASVSQGGSVNVAETKVISGSTTSFNFTPATGYHLKAATGCNGTLNGNTYATGAISNNCMVTADFERNTYALTVNAAAGGSFVVQNAKPQHGETVNIVAAPNAGYGVSSFSGCGAGTTDYSVYTTAPITADCSVSLSFKKIVAIQGTAAEGDALANAQVDTKCSDGSAFTAKVNTDSKGKFIGQVGEQAFPCALKVTTTSSPAKTYYSIATQAGTTNINLLTDMSLILASGKSGADWYASNDWVSVKNNLASAQTSLKTSLYNLGYILPVGDFLPFTSTFQLDDSFDKLMDQIQIGIQKTPGITYESLIGLLKSGDASLVPSPTGGKEPTAEVCFNPVLYAEGTTVTYVRARSETAKLTFTTTNGVINIENDLPILTRSTTNLQSDSTEGTPELEEGTDKLLVNLPEKIVGFVSFSAKSVDMANIPGQWFFDYSYTGTYTNIIDKIDYKISKGNSWVEESVLSFNFIFSGQGNISESYINNTYTFKGVTKVLRKGSEYRVCDFEIQKAPIQQELFAPFHEYYMVGSGVGLAEDTISITLNGQELLNGQPN